MHLGHALTDVPGDGGDELLAGDAWRSSQELLARTSAAPALSLTAGNA